jgi:hypothetical protein
MTESDQSLYNAMTRRIRAMTKQEKHELVKQDKCPFEPEHLKEVPMGMFHCPVCGEMVLAGLPHHRKTL